MYLLLYFFFFFLSILATSFSIRNTKVKHFAVFSPKQVNCFLKFSAKSFKWKAIGIILGALYFKLHMLCAVLLYSPV